MPKTIQVDDVEGWNSIDETFVTIKGGPLVIEHSLKSIEKWEAITEKCFLDCRDLKTNEFLLYVKCMTLNKVPDSIYTILSQSNLEDIKKYMARKMTATNLVDKPNQGRSGEQSTAEMIYYQMFSLGIPLELSKWHINRLLILIRLMSRMNEAAYNPKKKNRRLTGAEIAQRDKLNAQRLKEFGTTG